MIRDDGFWRELVAKAAAVEGHTVTQNAPAGFAEAIGGKQWFTVSLGKMVLCHDGEWRFPGGRGAPTNIKMAYAFRSASDALQALRAAVSPAEPDCASWVQAIYNPEGRS
jgi:hypothetical protein